MKKALSQWFWSVVALVFCAYHDWPVWGCIAMVLVINNSHDVWKIYWRRETAKENETTAAQAAGRTDRVVEHLAEIASRMQRMTIDLSSQSDVDAINSAVREGTLPQAEANAMLTQIAVRENQERLRQEAERKKNREILRKRIDERRAAELRRQREESRIDQPATIEIPRGLSDAPTTDVIEIDALQLTTMRDQSLNAESETGTSGGDLYLPRKSGRRGK